MALHSLQLFETGGYNGRNDVDFTLKWTTKTLLKFINLQTIQGLLTKDADDPPDPGENSQHNTSDEERLDNPAPIAT